MKKNNHKFSIITITYNAEATIESTIKSVINQKYSPLEYILVDGLSTDKTVEIINNYIPKLRDAGIDVKLKSEKDNGISDAFNKGIKIATGDIIGIINSGDNYADNVINFVNDNIDDINDVYCGNILWIDEINKCSHIRKSDVRWSRLKYEMTIMHPSCFVKKECYDKYGIFDMSYKYAMDYDLLCRFHRNGVKFKYFDRIIASMIAGGISDTNINKIKSEVLSINGMNGINKILSNIYWLFVKLRYIVSKVVHKFGILTNDIKLY